MDKSQISAFLNYMLGDRNLGGTDPDNPVCTPHSPELRAFCFAVLGDQMPERPWLLSHPEYRPMRVQMQATAVAKLLREVADGIDPVEAAAGDKAEAA